MKISKSVATEIMESSNNDKVDNFVIVDEGNWENSGKYEFRSVIFKDNTNGSFYQLGDSRTGSYFTDYYYESEDWEKEVEVDEVVPVTKTVITFEVKK